MIVFSGPPKFRLRDPLDILYGEIDFAIIANIVAWAIAGTWVIHKLFEMYSGRIPRLTLLWPQKLALIVIALLGASTFVSVAPALTAFKVYQILVSFLFSLICVELYGVEYCLDRLWLYSMLLCSLIALFLLINPDLVLFASETGFPRLRGMGIVDTGTVAVFGIVLLWTTTRKLPKFIFGVSALFLGVLLFFSLARNAWIAVCAFFALALVKRPKIRSLPSVYLFWILAIAAMGAGLYSQINELRDPETVYNLSDRVGLWSYLSTTTLTQSPWLGLGFVAGAREYGMQYDVPLGSGHSIFFEAFVGGGILTITVFTILFVALGFLVKRLLREHSDPITFALCGLFVVVFVLGLVGEDIDSSPYGFAFWCLVTMISVQMGKVKKKRIPTYEAATLT